jgi:pimeloyl-ACP methyl ester carboxylesterase
MVKVSVATDSQKLLGDTPLVLMRECGHGPYYERPDDFNKVVVDFLHGRLEAGAKVTI